MTADFAFHLDDEEGEVRLKARSSTLNAEPDNTPAFAQNGKMKKLTYL
jgi:hypothetical protein